MPRRGGKNRGQPESSCGERAIVAEAKGERAGRDRSRAFFPAIFARTACYASFPPQLTVPRGCEGGRGAQEVGTLAESRQRPLTDYFSNFFSSAPFFLFIFFFISTPRGGRRGSQPFGIPTGWSSHLLFRSPRPAEFRSLNFYYNERMTRKRGAAALD